MLLLVSRTHSAYKWSIMCSIDDYCCTCNKCIANCKHLCWRLGKNAFFLRVVRCRSLAEEYSVDSVNKDEISKLEMNVLSD